VAYIAVFFVAVRSAERIFCFVTKASFSELLFNGLSAQLSNFFIKNHEFLVPGKAQQAEGTALDEQSPTMLVT
jgi:hypothetical protein